MNVGFNLVYTALLQVGFEIQIESWISNDLKNWPSFICKAVTQLTPDASDFAERNMMNKCLMAVTNLDFFPQKRVKEE